MILVLIPLFVLSLTQTRSTQTPLSQVLERLKKYPLDVTAHKNLLQLYISYKQLALAKQEFQLLQEPLNSLFGDFQVLGVDSQTQQALQILTDTPRIHSEQKSYWESVTRNYPTYKDAWIQLLFLAYNSGDKVAAKNYLDKIKTLDPNFINQLPQPLLNL